MLVLLEQQDWNSRMKITQHSQYLAQLTQFPQWLPINTYLVREADGFTLVDTGFGGGPAILAAAQQLGAPIQRIVLTHVHGDHVGSLDVLHKALPTVPVLLSAREARLLAGDRTFDPSEAQAKLRGSFLNVKTRPTATLADGDEIGSLRVISAPGHTPGHIALLDQRDGSLIAGDAFQTRAGLAVAGVVRWLFPLPALATWHLPTALASARRLRALAPTCLAVGHGAVLADPLAALDEVIAEAARIVEDRGNHGA